MRLAGDELVAGPVVQTTEAVWIDAPAGAVWPWLVQMGQDRGGLYSYESLENVAGCSITTPIASIPNGSVWLWAT